MKQLVTILICLIGHFHSLIASESPEIKNPYGSFFSCVRVKDTFVENVGPVATYTLLARNFPPNQTIILYRENLDGPMQSIRRYDVDDDGQLGRQINNATLMLDNEPMLMFDFLKGEPITYWLRSLDSTISLSSQIVPYPIHAEAVDGATISIRRLTSDAQLVLCEGYDFHPDEKLLISSQAGSKQAHNVPISCKNGKFSMIFEPGSPDRSGGSAYVHIQRFGERLTLAYDWGCEAVSAKKRMGNTQKIQPDALLKLPSDLD